MNLEETVRAAVRDLADDAPVPPDLAGAARSRGRRLRRRRRTGLAAAVLVLVATAVTPYAMLRRTPPRHAPLDLPAPSVAPSLAAPQWWRSPYRLPGGVIVTALARPSGDSRHAGTTVRDGNVLLDRATGRYVVLANSYFTISGSPAGGRAVAQKEEGGTGLVDTRGSRSLWLSKIGGPQWSTDGSRVLFTTDDGFAIMDASTGKVERHPVTGLRCPDDCFFTWLPGEREVAIALRDTSVKHDELARDKVKEVAIYSVAGGKRVRTVPVAGAPVGQDAWSPDGQLVLANDSDAFPDQPKIIVEVAGGRVVGRVPGTNPHFLPDGRILSLTDAEAVLYDDTGRQLETQELPADLAGRQLSIGRL